MDKLFTLILVVFYFMPSIYSSSTEPESDIDEKIMNIMNKYREVLADGKWILPPLDPFVVPPFNVSYVKGSANVTGTSLKMVTTGATSYQINNLHINLASGDFDENVFEPHFHVEGEYKSVGQLADHLPVNGEGSYKCDVYNTTIIINGQLGEDKNGSLYFTDLHFNVHVDKMKFTLKGLVLGPVYDAIISAIVSDAAPMFINSNIPLFDKFISEAVKIGITPLLNQFTTNQALDFINKYG